MMRIATRGLFAILRRHVCQELQVRPEEVEKKLEDWILIGTNCVTNCNSILAHQGPWLSKASAFKQLNQPIRFDLYIFIPGIYQYFKSNNSSGHGRLWVCWFRLKCRGFARSKAGDWSQTRPDLWPRPDDMPMASHSGPVVATKKTRQLLEVVTKLGGQQFPGFYWYFTRHENRVFLQNRAWIMKYWETSKEDKGFLKTRKNLQHVSRVAHFFKWTIHPSFSWKFMSGSSWYILMAMMSHDESWASSFPEIHRNPP